MDFYTHHSIFHFIIIISDSLLCTEVIWNTILIVITFNNNNNDNNNNWQVRFRLSCTIPSLFSFYYKWGRNLTILRHDNMKLNTNIRKFHFDPDPIPTTTPILCNIRSHTQTPQFWFVLIYSDLFLISKERKKERKNSRSVHTIVRCIWWCIKSICVTIAFDLWVVSNFKRVLHLPMIANVI